jgi:tetratricopeptide (TPR) repeat protein
MIAALIMTAALTQPAAVSDAAKAFAEANAHFEKNENTEALAAYERAIALDPARADFHVGKGRTLARLRRYDDAFAAYGAALKLEPQNPMILRYRGHNYINVQRLDDALADLTRAESMKKDDYGIYYHLALARYLKGDYAQAAQAYEGCVRTAEIADARAAEKTDNSRVACLAWQYLALRRAGRDADAKKVLDAATPNLQVTESAAYLDRLLLFKGAKNEAEVAALMDKGPLETSTIGYGVGIWHLLNGRPDRAKEYFTKATSTDAWYAFGHIASAIELKRMK